MQPSKHQGRVPILLTSAEVLEACEEGYKQFAETMRNSRREAWTYTIPGNQRCCGYTDGDFASAERTPEETRSTRDMPTVYEISAAIPRWPTLYADVSTSIQVMLLDEGIQPHKHTPKNLTLQFSLHYHADKLQKCLRKAAISPKRSITMETNLLNINQIASLLKISKKRVESLLESDAFPFNRYHRRVIVKAENLIQYLAGRLAKVDSILPSHKEMGDKA